MICPVPLNQNVFTFLSFLNEEGGHFYFVLKGK